MHHQSDLISAILILRKYWFSESPPTCKGIYNISILLICSAQLTEKNREYEDEYDPFQHREIEKPNT